MNWPAYRETENLWKDYIRWLKSKYQEALINEQSQPGNVLIIDNARTPYRPSKPNRALIIIVGLLIGVGLAFAYVFLKNYFDNTIKTPEDLQKRNLNVLAWIPRVEELTLKESSEFDFIVLNQPDSVTSESFRALRTRIQFSRPDKETLKTIVVTSPAPQEGKTFVTLNLAEVLHRQIKKFFLWIAILENPEYTVCLMLIRSRV